ncbi:MAG: Diaminopimelate decarboxylase [Phycisphaerae bacterium]|nr:Diaminopimelate decarboxylase [Phycisphaerae bacterium]
MDHFEYRDGQLYCEGVSADRIVQEVGTPVYVYSKATLLHHFGQIVEAFAPLDATVCYAVKTNGNLHICRVLAEAGAGFDVVSGGEIHRALAAGGDPARIVFAGVGKSDREIAEAIEAGVGLFNVESEPELENIDRIAGRMGRPARGALRVNPDVDPRTHTYITTGKKETKFGVDIERAMAIFRAHARRLGNRAAAPDRPGLHLRGIHLHIGSQITTVQPYVDATAKTLALIDGLRGEGFAIDSLDLGGGFGINYQAEEALPASAFAEALVPMLRGRGLRITLEPGRFIAGNAGVMLTQVQYVKSGGDRRFVIVDAAMNDLIRPMLYGAFHFIWPTRVKASFVPPAVRTEAANLPGLSAVDVVGPICESGDFFAKDRPLPPVARGDRLAIFSAGAYGFAMASQYNARPRPPEVLVDGEGYRIIRRRESYDDLIAHERD